MIPWVGGKGKLMWLINLLAPACYNRFVDVFGGSATVTLNRPLKKGCLEVYNDYNSNLTNLFFCVKERTMALLKELGFLPLNSRDDFNVLYKFFSREEFTDDYLEEELELTRVYLDPPQAEAIQRLMTERSRLSDTRRAADYFKLIRYSFSGGGKAFAGRSCDLRQFFYLIWECARRLARVVIENKDFEGVIVQYDRPDAVIYSDPPYYEAEDCYAVVFTEDDHRRLHDVLLKCQGFVMVSYNDCEFIRELYKEFYIFRTVRPNSMSQKAGSEYVELLITNYDPRDFPSQCSNLPPANENNRRAFAYLLKHRHLDRDVLTSFVRLGLVYEDKGYHNAVFVGKDKDGTAHHAHKRSTNSQGKSFRMTVEGSDFRYAFNWPGTSGHLLVFEAPIDMLSFISTYHDSDWTKHSYVALCGTSSQPLLGMLERCPNIEHVHLALDNDQAGQLATRRLAKVVREKGLTVDAMVPVGKDWNEDLCANFEQTMEEQQHEQSVS